MTPLLTIATAVSCALNVLLMLHVWQLSTISRELSPQAPNFKYTYPPREISAPIGRTTLAMQAPDRAFAIHDDAAWAALVPYKRGFVRLGPHGVPFSPAVYHQLHCINMVRWAYRGTRDGVFKTADAHVTAFGHANHCFDLLRQSVLCKADTTLMPVPAASARSDETGTAVVRRCRNAAQILEFAQGNQAFWDGIPYTVDFYADYLNGKLDF
ncbi:hypothetical protein GGX14DRAFT_399032 [Mycena pura]|uniref:Uncharacterized protein n=1 Tax=Mycena pura TaxID=153505 RepID=A0AAD6Y760_9AGAR|nr:hypothetical protein GGX14DRAFT_399032 [Mycena pura]